MSSAADILVSEGWHLCHAPLCLRGAKLKAGIYQLPTLVKGAARVASELRRTISVPQGVALYLDAVVGAGVLLPGLGASQAGPASLVSWAFDCVLGVPLVLTFAALAAKTRMPVAC